MTERLYESDSSCRRFTATVLACNATDGGYTVELDRTAFFPEGGGQPADTGCLGGVEVTYVSLRDGRIYHHVTAPLSVGDMVEGELDWEPRLRRMQNHGAEHILSGLIHNQYGYLNVGFHMGSEDVTLDVSGELTREQLTAIEDEANRIITEDRAILAWYPSDEELKDLVYRSKKEIDGPLRIVTVDGVDSCACCAPHLPSTAQIGMVKILDFIRYKGGVRIHIQAGLDALDDYRMRYEQTAAAAALLSVKQNALTDAVERLQEERDGLKTALREARRQLAALQVQAVEPTEAPVCLFGEDMDAETLRQAVNGLSERCGGICGAFTATENGCRYVVGGRGDVPAFCRRMHEALGGRGGGSPVMQQGQVPADEKAVRTFFAAQA